MPYEYRTAAKAGWAGDLGDDCHLERYGLVAHVEQMDRNCWWFAVYDGWEAGRKQLFNSADQQTALPITSGAKARCAAECVMELLHGQASV